MHTTFLTNLNSITTPSFVFEALFDRKWKQAMDVEMEKKPVGCKWVYTKKCQTDGTIECYKTRLMGKGFTQTYGVD